MTCRLKEDIQADLDRSIERIAKSEQQLANVAGFAATKQGQALRRAYIDQLTHAIHAYRCYRKTDITTALTGKKSQDIAGRLLVAGFTIGTGEPKEMGDAARRIGRLLGYRSGRLALDIGMWGIKMLLKLPIFVLENGLPTLLLTDDTDGLLNEVVANAVRANPLLLPLRTPPVPWAQVRRGVTPPGHWAQPPLVITHHPSIEEIWRKAIGGNGQMRPVLDAVNYLQSTPFVINQPLLDLLNREPPLTVPDEPDPELPGATKWWAKRLRRQAIDRQNALNFDRAAAASLAFQPFYVPLNLDSRGRIYAISHFAFAREDRIRALFLFANGAPIGVEGLQWLKAHVAGKADGVTWSVNKKPSRLNLEGRVAWVDANVEYLRDIGEAVLSGGPLAEDDLPPPNGDRYQFAASCAELVQAGGDPGYKTRLPLTFDGSCSGLQHLCAMTRDEVGGQYVNLVAGDEAEDFYAHVAAIVHKTCSDLMSGSDDRALVKKPVMTYFYGSGIGGWSQKKCEWFGMTEQVVEVLRERGRSANGAERLARAIYSAIGDSVPSAIEVRRFLEQLCKDCAEKGQHLRWTTPLGLPVVNCYYELKIEDLSYTLEGRRVRVRHVVGVKDDLDTRKAVKAVTANFVHSCDAAHLHLIALAAQSEGIEMASVHDSFACIAPHAKRFNMIIREQLRGLYEEHDVFGAFLLPRRGVEQPPPPPPQMGTLDLRQVIDSYHAFK